MNRFFAAALAALLVFPSAASRAAGDPVCAEAHFPAKDLPVAGTVAALKGCDSEALYYGMGMPADPVRARACAFSERNGDSGPFSGDALLMTIYANGAGVERNLAVAIALACQIGGAPAEIEGRIRHLTALKNGTATGEFSWCDDITSGLGDTFCADHEARLQRPKREARIAQLAKRWQGAAAPLFATLKSAADAFADSRGDNEVSPLGTAHAALEIGEKETSRQQFLDDLQGFADGKPPTAGAEQASDADARLNAVYRKIMGVPAETFAENTGKVRQAGIKDAQRAWLKYRDAWVAFLATAYPGVPKAAAVNWLTLRRVTQLEEFAGN